MSAGPTQESSSRLSPRELEVAGMVAQGLTNREIAAKLFISERTVDGHLEHIREKLGVNTRAQVAAWVVRRESAVIAGPAAVPSTGEAPRGWALAHPRAWLAAALLMALLAAGVGVLRLTALPPPVIQTIAGSTCPNVVYPGGCFGGDGDQTAVRAQLARPTSVAVDSKGVIYIADYGNGRIRRVAHGVMSTLVGSGKSPLADEVLGISVSSDSLGYVSTVVVDHHDQLYLLTARDDLLEVWTVDSSGFMHSVVTLGPAYITHFQFGPNLPVGGLAITQAGVLFIADRDGNRVVKYDGKLSPYAGTGEGGYADGGDAQSARLDWPIGLALDSKENLYIADTGNNRIRMVDHAKGTIRTVAGAGEFEGNTGDQGPATQAHLSFPFGVAVARDGTVLFSDTGNHRIRAITPGGTIYAVAGTGRWGFSGDGEAALEAEFIGPEGVALDSAGDLFIADTENQRVREIPHLVGRP
ncbi:MAG TPA: LuxR C-terminal-related transcriptional regulator [Candidatus Limnocylindrales bacterium]|nr:LuxR C-terminal-related transcriptional regulator [Candidatus Limnocylindrales bacterium]